MTSSIHTWQILFVFSQCNESSQIPEYQILKICQYFPKIYGLKKSQHNATFTHSNFPIFAQYSHFSRCLISDDNIIYLNTKKDHIL